MAFMSMNKYQSKAYKTAAYGDQRLYPFMALAEEAGEVLGKIAKYMRKTGTQPDFDNMDDDLHQVLLSELGDVLWNVAVCALELDIDLETLAELNLDKLQGRAGRGTIVGEGDER
jgi:NTP pyrophosphatase (non-canonical NTP hydrolase)